MSNLTPRIDKLDKNYVINGGMDFWQRNTTYTVNTAATTFVYVADRFNFVSLGSTVKNFNIARSASVPTLAQSNFNYNYSLQFSCLTAIPSPSNTTDLVVPFRHRIEGYSYAEIHGKAITVSFWIKTNKTGLHPFFAYSDAAARTYITSFTVNSANTWEKKVINLTLESLNTYNITSGIGLEFGICSGSGTWTSTSNLGTWQNYFSGIAAFTFPGAVNIMDSNTNTLNITGLQIQVGTFTDVDFSRAGRNIGHELVLCQRYFEKTYEIDTIPGSITLAGATFAVAANSASQEIVTHIFKTVKRAQPTVRFYDRVTGTIDQIRNESTATPLAQVNGSVSTTSFQNGSGAKTSGALYTMHWTADAEL